MIFIFKYCIHGAEVWKCDNCNFRQELIELLAKQERLFFSIPRRHSLRGNEFSCEHLVIYSMEDSFYSYINIFYQMVCKYHSSLEQGAISEQDDMLISLKVGDKHESSDLIREFCEIHSDNILMKVL